MSYSRETNSPRDHPRGEFYSIVPAGEGLVDVFLDPQPRVYRTMLGVEERDLSVIVVRGVEDSPDLEEQIRRHYYDWYASGKRIDL